MHLWRWVLQIEFVVGKIEEPAAVALPEADAAGVVPGVLESAGGPVRGKVDVALPGLGDGERGRDTYRRSEKSLKLELGGGWNRPQSDGERERK